MTMHRIALFFFINLFTLTLAKEGFAQTEVDSLRQSLLTLEGNPRIDALNDLASYLLTIDPFESDSLLKTSLNLIEKKGYQHGKVKAWLIQATMFSQQRRLPQADSVLLLAIPLAVDLNDLKSISMAQLTLGVLNSRKGQYAEALENHIYGKKIANELGELDLELSHLLNIGSLKQLVNDLDGAEEYLMEALEISESNQFSFRSGQVYVNLAVVAYKQNDLKQSIGYNKKALDLFRKENDKSQAAICLNNLGFAYNLLGEDDKAISYYDEAMKLSNEVNDKFGVATILLNQARILKSNKQYNKASSKALEALVVADEIKDKFSKSRVRLFLAELFEETGKAALALDNFKAYKALEDSLARKANLDKIAELTAEFELERREKELLLSRQQLRLLNARQLQLIVLVLLLIIIMVTVVIVYKSKVKRARVNELLAESQAKNEELIREQLSGELKKREEELKSYAGEFSRQNGLLNGLRNEVEELKTSNEQELGKQLIKKLSEQVQRRPVDYLSWKEFRLKFDEVHPEFMPGLVEQFPQLTAYERDFSSLIKINLSNKEVAQILNISHDSAKKSIQRIYRKLSFSSAEEFRAFILKL